MAINLKPVDVAVVGLGAAGGVAVLPLARAGLKVAGIEAGTWMDPAKDFKPDEIHNNVRGLVTTVPKAKSEIPTFRTSPDVTGTARRNASDDERRRRHVDSLSCAKLAAEALGFQDALGNHQALWRESASRRDRRSRIGRSATTNWSRTTTSSSMKSAFRARRAIFRARWIRRAMFTKVRGSASIRCRRCGPCDFLDHMHKAAKSLGWKPFHAPSAINSQPYRGRAACAYHGYCDRGGCHVRAKNSTCFTTIPEAQKTKNLTIFDKAQVTRIVADGNGKVTGVLYIREGKEYFQPAKVVLVASYTYENTRLLLLSKSKAYPNGLSNNHGQVGKHYFGHWDAQAGVGVTALFPMDVNTWYGAMLSQGVVIDEWADDTFDHSGLGFIGGASLCTYMEKHPIAAASMLTFGRAPGWGSKWKQFVHENAGRFTGVLSADQQFSLREHVSGS